LFLDSGFGRNRRSWRWNRLVNSRNLTCASSSWAPGIRTSSRSSRRTPA